MWHPIEDFRPARRLVLLGFLLGLGWLSACAPLSPPARTAMAPPVPTMQAWWLRWNDPILNALQERLATHSPTVQVAAAAVRQAQAVLRERQSKLLPSVGLQASGQRGNAAGGSVATSVGVSLPLQWELDVWGRLDEQVRASQAQVLASQADWAMARLSAQVTLVQLYVQLRANERQLEVLQRTEDGLFKAWQLTQDRESAGVASRQDVVQARLQWRNTQASQQEAQATARRLRHALAVLVGDEPDSWPWTPTGVLPALTSVPEVVSAQGLQQRPDIAAAQARLLAAQAGVGVAQKAFFPSLTFNASAGYRSAELGSLLTAPTRVWALGSALAVTLLDGGARQAVTEQAQAALDAAGASYRQTVLTALQEVQDNLVLAQSLAEQVRLHDDALVAARQNLVMTEAQYQAGTVSYLNVILAQSSTLNAELAAINDRLRLLQAHNLLLANTQGLLGAGAASP